MLTNQERAKIAERLCKCDYTVIWNLYKAVTGEEVPNNTSYDDDVETICKKIIDLCDTSNMIELPLDKDGKVIHIGDMVWFEGIKETVSAIEMYKDTVYIHLTSPKRPNTFSSPNVLTHVDIISEYERIDQVCEMEDAGEVPESALKNLTTWFCSECGSPIYNDVKPAYCPHCGARVVSENE